MQKVRDTLLAARIVDESYFGMEIEACYFRLRLRLGLISRGVSN
jgi:hypothetical protein